MLGSPGLTIGWPGIWLRWPRRACRAGLWQFENWKGKKFFRAVRCCSWSSRTDICQFVYWQMSSPCIKTICGWIMLPFFHRLPFVRVYFRHRLDRFIWILINSLTGLKSTFHAFCICIRFVFHLFFFCIDSSSKSVGRCNYVLSDCFAPVSLFVPTLALFFQARCPLSWSQ